MKATLKKVISLITVKHICCFCNKTFDYELGSGSRMITMSCNKCGKERTRIIKPQEIDTVEDPISGKDIPLTSHQINYYREAYAKE